MPFLQGVPANFLEEIFQRLGCAREGRERERRLDRRLTPGIGGWPKGRKREGVRGEMI